MSINLLIDSIKSGDVLEVQRQLRIDPELLNRTVIDGYSILHLACRFGQESLVGLILSQGALVNLNSCDQAQVTALHLAVSLDDESMAERCVRLLLSHGAELNAPDSEGGTALHIAVQRGSLLLVNCLVQSGGDPHLKNGRGLSAMDEVKQMSLSHPSGRFEILKEALKQAHSLQSES
jgi:ankyrin repeat protein